MPCRKSESDILNTSKEKARACRRAFLLSFQVFVVTVSTSGRAATLFVADAANLVAIHLADSAKCSDRAVAEVALRAQFIGMKAMREGHFTASRVVGSREIGVSLELFSHGGGCHEQYNYQQCYRSQHGVSWMFYQLTDPPPSRFYKGSQQEIQEL